MLESLMMQGKLRTEPNIGDFWEGGYYTGKIGINGKIYALVLAPKSTGESPAPLPWKTSNTNTNNTLSLSDGWSNTQAMVAVGIGLHPAGKFCHDLVIDGYDDWYLPSVDELEMCYRAFRPRTGNNSVTASGRPNIANGVNPSSIPPGEVYTLTSPAQTSLVEFQFGNSQAFTNVYYWTSSQKDPATGWIQTFNNGAQNYNNKSVSYSIRAVRRVLLG